MTQTVVNSGQTVANTTLNNGDTMFVLSGGTATGTAILAGAMQQLFSGGLAKATSVSSGGSAGPTGSPWRNRWRSTSAARRCRR